MLDYGVAETVTETNEFRTSLEFVVDRPQGPVSHPSIKNTENSETAYGQEALVPETRKVIKIHIQKIDNLYYKLPFHCVFHLYKEGCEQQQFSITLLSWWFY